MRILRLLPYSLMLFAFACGTSTSQAINENPTGKESSQENSRQIILSGPANLRNLSNNVLERLTALPRGAEIEVPVGAAPVFYDFRDSTGAVKRSTNGFYPSLKLISVPAQDQASFPADLIERINSTAGGLFMSSLDLNSGLEPGGVIPALPSTGAPDERYLKYYNPQGKRLRNSYSAILRRKFGTQLNRAIPMSSLPEQDQKKWGGIYSELVQIVDRTRDTNRKNLFIDSGNANQDVEMAKQFSIIFENSGQIQTYGAWSVAVLGTAPRHGFGNVPCAEFASETLRQAYTRAGYRMADDFKGNNYLIFSNTAAVVYLARALFESGWIPWDSADFKPKIGAVAMHADANTPGHAYMIAGENGRFIVDNGSPKGRDLFKTGSYQRDIIGMMYDHGVFFLPPGILPERW